jgi:hypothetical protein
MNEELEWSSPEFHFVERSGGWYLVSIVAAIALAIFAIFQKNYLFLIFIFIGEITLLFIARQKPRLYGYSITPQGIQVDGELIYLFSDMSAFALFDDGISGYIELVLRPKKKYAQFVKILLPRPLMAAVDRAVGLRLPEFTYEETFREMFLKKIGL